MMDFLRGLAPRRDGDSSWAAPVVPSRFSGVRPVSLEPLALEVPAAVASEAARSSQQSDGRMFPAPAADRAAASIASLASRPLLPSIPQAQAPPEIHHHHHEPGAVERIITPVVTPQGAQRRVTPAATPAPVQRAPILRVETPVADSRPSRAVAQPPLLQTVHVLAPLSPAAVAERRGAPVAERPVIQVTIDRIEVRAPGTTRPGARTSRGRATSPSVSLADYLRGPRKGGGAL